MNISHLNKGQYNKNYYKKSRTFLNNAISFIIIIFFSLLSFDPLPVINTTKFVIAFDLILIYYWSLYLSNIFTTTYAFLIGIIFDILSNLPLGMNSLIYVLGREFIVSQSKLFLNKSFPLIWLGFTFFIALILLSRWMILIFLYKKFFYSNLIFIQFLISFITYPLIHLLLEKAKIFLLRDENA